MKVCANISQIGKPVVLCGCAVPEQFEEKTERKLFSEIHYIAVTCNTEELLHRLKYGRGITDEKWISSSIDFNNWLISNADLTKPQITLIDTTNKSPREAAFEFNRFIMERINRNKT